VLQQAWLLFWKWCNLLSVSKAAFVYIVRYKEGKIPVQLGNHKELVSINRLRGSVPKFCIWRNWGRCTGVQIVHARKYDLACSLCVCVRSRNYVRVCVCVWARVCVCMCEFAYLCMFDRMYLYVCVCKFMRVCISTRSTFQTSENTWNTLKRVFPLTVRI
jgi:hypothetical protein